ncbi:hypothetical protein M9Y10_002677 [Tritrichomonas musculus]|uniref:Uncharacterized protein n=1 Tax=Tritrichomonas musculus TaxID=1915356 RepID=A0ABR2LBI9_9EUKA
MSSEEQEKQQLSLKELILLYQSKLRSSSSHKSQVTEESLDALYKLQNALRQTSVLYNAICNSDPIQLCALLLSGNISSMSKVKKPYFTRAFSNKSFVNQSTYLIAFLRENLHFTANLFFKAIDTKAVDPKFLSFSTIPTLFQNGWCVEEDLLWSTFLTCYLRLMERTVLSDHNSPLFYPFKAFFLQKLSLDYLQLALASDLQSFVDDKDITSLRVHFEFDAINMVPKLYMNRIHQSAKNIINKLNFYENRIPLSIRRLLAHISSSQITINKVTYRDINVANFFFVNCCLLPVLSEPYMIGLDTTTTPQFVFDDLYNLFFYSNHSNLKPPSCFTLTKVINPEEFQTSKLVDSLIQSANLEPISEFHESLFQLMSDRYQKTITFMPLDLYYIHVAFVKFSNAFADALDENGTKSLHSFDFLMNIAPEVNQEQQYNMFTQQIKTLALPPRSFVPKKFTPMERCYKTALSNISVLLFDSVGDEKAMEFELQKVKQQKPSETEFAVALEITLKSYRKDSSEIRNFLITQIETLDKVQNSNNELATDIKLTYNEMQSLYKRTLLLCTRLASVAIRMLINYLIRNYYLTSVAYIDTHKSKYALSGVDFFNLYNNILRSSAKIIQKTVKCDKVDPDMSKISIVKFNNILYFTLLDRISITSFIESREDQGKIIAAIISQMKWQSDTRVQEALAAAQTLTETSKLNILMRGVEVLIGAVNSSSISMAVHLILQAITTVLSAVEGSSESVKLGCVIWVILHSNIEMLFYIHKFISHFYSGSLQLVDICGNENPKFWKFFAYAIDLLTKSPEPAKKDAKHSHRQKQQEQQKLQDQQRKDQKQLHKKQQAQQQQKMSQAQQQQKEPKLQAQQKQKNPINQQKQQAQQNQKQQLLKQQKQQQPQQQVHAKSQHQGHVNLQNPEHHIHMQNQKQHVNQNVSKGQQLQHQKLEQQQHKVPQQQQQEQHEEPQQEQHEQHEEPQKEQQEQHEEQQKEQQEQHEEQQKEQQEQHEEPQKEQQEQHEEPQKEQQEQHEEQQKEQQEQHEEPQKEQQEQHEEPQKEQQEQHEEQQKEQQEQHEEPQKEQQEQHEEPQKEQQEQHEEQQKEQQEQHEEPQKEQQEQHEEPQQEQHEEPQQEQHEESQQEQHEQHEEPQQEQHEESQQEQHEEPQQEQHEESQQEPNQEQ